MGESERASERRLGGEIAQLYDARWAAIANWLAQVRALEMWLRHGGRQRQRQRQWRGSARSDLHVIVIRARQTRHSPLEVSSRRRPNLGVVASWRRLLRGWPAGAEQLH